MIPPESHSPASGSFYAPPSAREPASVVQRRWIIAFALSVAYLIAGFQIFQWFFRLSRRAGTLLGQGE